MINDGLQTQGEDPRQTGHVENTGPAPSPEMITGQYMSR